MTKTNFSSSLVSATFESRLNRFTLRCLVEGEPILAYLANPARLWEIFLPGRKLYLKPSNRSNKLPYNVIAADLEGIPVLLDPHLTNFFLEKWLRQKLIPGLEKYSIVKKEFQLDSSRFDFLLKSKQGFMVLEVKSCTLLAYRAAFFPDAVSQRGKRHLLKLADLAEQSGWQSMMLFVVWWPKARYFLPEFHIDWAFAQAFLANKNKINYLAIAATLNHNFEPDEGSIHQLIIPWDLLEREMRDRGVYLLLIKVEEETTLSVGHLGNIPFRPGYYIYVGSAKKNLQARLNRHRRHQKKLFWHIDYLLAKAKLCHLLPIRSATDLECTLADRLSYLAKPIFSFGCSDCHCPSHLFFSPTNPIHSPPFIYLLQEFRYQRLESELT
ncbi:MAG: DNA/RNA nuclease SfsA [Candidatus Aminicenantes bacterium]|nr:DNA/RNA nuclease SfsA [Candidatus Aminicenantes bacterium]